MKKQKQKTEISTLVDELCDMLRRWSAAPESLPIGDIDKAASTLKKLQDIRLTEETQPEADKLAPVVVTHHIPRTDETAEKEEGQTA